MLVTLAALLLGLAVIALILGLIQPKWVLIGNGHKTRAKVLLIYSLVFVIGIILNVIALPSSFEAGKKALSDKITSMPSSNSKVFHQMISITVKHRLY